MRLFYTECFRQSYTKAPEAVRRAFDRRAQYLAGNLRHPFLRAKKYNATRDIWQARVNGGWRFYLRIEADTIILLDMIPHP